jgi:hypothetical protein
VLTEQVDETAAPLHAGGFSLKEEETTSLVKCI